jgi:hypothetical protein
MRRKTQPAMTLFVCLLLAAGFVLPCGAEDFVAKQGVALYRVELQNLAQQILKLDPEDTNQREFLERLFQMKFTDAERMFEVCGDGMVVKRSIAELYLVKALVADSLGDWIQAYFSVKDAVEWNRQVMTQSLQIGEKAYNIPTFSNDLENKAKQWGNRVRFVIKPFDPDTMYQPAKVVLARSGDGETDNKAVRSTSRARVKRDADSPGGRWDTQVEPLGNAEISLKDQAFLYERFNKALYAYYYDPGEKNAKFEVFLPHGEYHVYEKDFAIHPVDFEVTKKKTQVTLQPARWFRLTVTDEVHPSNVHLTYHGERWEDYDHVPFGSYKVHVKSNEFTGPAVLITFVPAEMDGESVATPKKAKGDVVVVEERGDYELSLRARTGNEKMRYSLLGF